MNISVTTDTKTNDRVFRASSFMVDDRGYLHVLDTAGLAVAVFAAGSWSSAAKE